MALNFNKMNFLVSFNPTSAFPLDSRSYFESYDAAAAAALKAVEAGSTDGTLYFGQTIAVVENNAAQLFIIQPDGTLGEVGGKISVDTNAFELTDSGTLKLLNFAEAVAGAQLTKGDDGKLRWVKPDTTTVDGLSTAITVLQTKVSDLESAIGNANSGLVKDVADLKTAATGFDTDIAALQTAVGAPKDGDTAATGIYGELDKKANAADVLTKTQTEIAISTAIANVNHLKRKIVANLEEVELYLNQADALHYIFMVPTELAAIAVDDRYDEYIIIELEDGSRSIEKVGSWEVDLSDYATKKSLEDYALKSSVNELSTTVSGLSGVVSENKTSTDAAIAAEKARAEAAEKKNSDDIAGLTTLLNTTKETADSALAKANTAQDGVDRINISIDGKLLTTDDRAKLDKLVLGDDGSVAVSGTINAANVKELDTWLETNGANHIINLTEQNFSSDVVEKINFITSVETTDFTVSNGKLSLNVIDGTKVNIGTNNDFAAVQTLVTAHSDKIGALESLNVTVTTNSNKLKNIEEVTIPALQQKFDNYVLNTVYTREMEEIRDILSWKEMNQ